MLANALEIFLNGLMLGAQYALFGLGLSLSLGVMRMINIAHGDFIVLGAYLSAVVTAATGLNCFASLAIVVPAMFVLGAALQALLLNRMVGRDPLAPLLLTFGLSIAIQNLLQQAFSGDTRSLAGGEFALRGLHLGAVSVGLLPLAATAASVALYAATHLLLARTHLGRQARAVADDPQAARLVGVDDRRFFALVTGFVFAVIALAAVLYGVRTPFSPFSGPERLLFAFEAVVLGGLGSLWGTFVGGLVIGLVQVAGLQVDTALGAFFGHLVFLFMLVARPQGLFRREAR
jgi:branched-chain amino acid transport system permease protein